MAKSERRQSVEAIGGPFIIDSLRGLLGLADMAARDQEERVANFRKRKFPDLADRAEAQHRTMLAHIGGVREFLRRLDEP